MSDIYLYEDVPVLKNKLDIRDEKTLDLIEAEQSRANMMILYERGFSDFTPAGLCELHQFLFGDIYDWAGKYRLINIEKRERLLGGRSVWYSNDEDIPRDLDPELFHIAFFNFPHKRPTFAFTSESGYTLGFRRRIAHSGLHAETGVFRTGPLSLPSERSARSQTSPGRVSERRTLPLWDLGREVLSKNAESLRSSDALMRVAVPKASRPRRAA